MCPPHIHITHRKARTHTCIQHTYRFTVSPFYISPLFFILSEEKKIQGPEGNGEYLNNFRAGVRKFIKVKDPIHSSVSSMDTALTSLLSCPLPCGDCPSVIHREHWAKVRRLIEPPSATLDLLPYTTESNWRTGVAVPPLCPCSCLITVLATLYCACFVCSSNTKSVKEGRPCQTFPMVISGT